MFWILAVENKSPVLAVSISIFVDKNPPVYPNIFYMFLFVQADDFVGHITTLVR